MLTLVTAVIAFIVLATIYYAVSDEIDCVLDGRGGTFAVRLLATPVAIGLFLTLAVFYPCSAELRRGSRHPGYFATLIKAARDLFGAIFK